MRINGISFKNIFCLIFNGLPFIYRLALPPPLYFQSSLNHYIAYCSFFPKRKIGFLQDMKMKSACVLTCIMAFCACSMATSNYCHMSCYSLYLQCDSYCRDPWAIAYQYDTCKSICGTDLTFCLSRCAGNPNYTTTTTLHPERIKK